MKSDAAFHRTICSIADIAEIIGGGTPKTSVPEYWNGEIPWLSVKDFCGDSKYVHCAEKHISIIGLNNSSTKLLKPNDIIISARGTVGELAMLRREMAFNQSCFGLRAKPVVDSHYLYYLLKVKIAELHNLSHGSVFDTITKDTFKNLACSLPSLATQRKIAAVLSSLDDKIETNHAICRNLEEQADVLFADRFVNFCDSEARIPDAWQLVPLSSIANVTSGKRPPMKQTIASVDVSVPLLGASAIMGYTNRILYDSRMLVIGRVGTHGVVQRVDYPCWPSDNTLVVFSSYYEFVYQVLKRMDYRALNRGSTQPLITQSDVLKEQILLPDSHSLNEYEACAGALMRMSDELKRQNSHLAALRDTLLPRLMSGEEDVSSVKLR